MVEMHIKDGVVFGRYRRGLVLDLESAKDMVSRRMEMQNGTTCALLVHLNGIQAGSKEVREYMATEGTKGLWCGAFVVENFTERNLIKFFLMFEKPKMPTKIFSNEDKALRWIESMK